MKTLPLSVGILTFNSARTLARALESVKRCSDIIVCDGGSLDETLEIALRYGARVISQDTAYKRPDGSLKDYAGVRNQCLAAAREQWFLYIDSDESVSPELIDELDRDVIRDTETAGYRIPERFIVEGKMVEYASNYPGYQYRVLRTGAGTRFVKPVHEQPPYFLPYAKLGTLDAPWYVYWDRNDIENYAKRNYKYLPLEVERSRATGRWRYLTRFVPWHLRAIVAISCKSILNRLLHPKSSHMPLSVEWSRIKYQVRLVLNTGSMIFSGK